MFLVTLPVARARKHQSQCTAAQLRGSPAPLVFVHAWMQPVQVGNYFPFDDLFSLICARQDFFFIFYFLFSARHKAAHMIDNACVLGWLLALRFDLGLLAVREDDRM